MNTQKSLATVIMAAGKGTRMKDPSKAKVMYKVCGKPMIHYVLDVAFDIGSDRVIAIVGYQRDTVIEYVRKSHPRAEFVIQAEQLGTGHAVMQTKSALDGFTGDVVVLSGDAPLLTKESLQRLIDYHYKTNAVGTILTAILQDPTGYGRILRNEDGSVKRIVEQKDATEEERKVQEINSGIYVFQTPFLFEALATLKQNNVQNEYYLTDVFEYFWKKNLKVSAIHADDENEILGVNTVEQLQLVQSIISERLSQN
jgi:UDP-N-acetylglucosamine pyrophosphorylase